MSEDIKTDIHKRLEALENEVKSLKTLKPESPNGPNGPNGKKEKKEKKEKKPRAQTAYNIFVSNYINEQKEKLGSEFKHKVAFGEAAKQWTEQKKTKTNTE